MSTGETLTAINIFLTSITLVVGYLTYQFSKRKDFEDKIFNIKIDIYKEINEISYDAYVRTSPNYTPFVEIYDFKDKDKWTKYYSDNILKMGNIAVDIEKIAFKNTIFIPPKVSDKIIDYSHYIDSYITQFAHFDTGLNCDSHDRLWELYIDLIFLIREDLKISTLDKGVVSRIKRKIG